MSAITSDTADGRKLSDMRTSNLHYYVLFIFNSLHFQNQNQKKSQLHDETCLEINFLTF